MGGQHSRRKLPHTASPFASPQRLSFARGKSDAAAKADGTWLPKDKRDIAKRMAEERSARSPRKTSLAFLLTLFAAPPPVPRAGSPESVSVLIRSALPCAVGNFRTFSCVFCTPLQVGKRRLWRMGGPLDHPLVPLGGPCLLGSPRPPRDSPTRRSLCRGSQRAPRRRISRCFSASSQGADTRYPIPSAPAAHAPTTEPHLPAFHFTPLRSCLQSFATWLLSNCKRSKLLFFYFLLISQPFLLISALFSPPIRPPVSVCSYAEVRMVAAKPGIAFVDFGTEGQATVALLGLNGFRLTNTHALAISYQK